MSLAKRYTLYTFLITLLLGVLFYPIEFYFTFKKESRSLTTEVYRILDSHMPSIVSSLWLTNTSLLQKQMENLTLFPYIERVEILDDEGTLLFSGPKATERLVKHEEILYYSYRGQDLEIGKVTLFLNFDKLSRDIKRDKIPDIAFHFLISVFLALTLALLFHYLVGRHLKDCAEFLKQEGMDNLATPLKLKRNREREDELGLLTASINEQRRKILAFIKEKELITKEIHHRIKNNMATVISLLSLQAEATKNPEVVSALKEAQIKLSGMEILYDKLYKSENFQEISLKGYLVPLAEEAVSLFSTSNPVTLITEVEDIVLRTKQLSVLGIIVNELITNSMKYAFPGERAGTILIRAEEKNGRLILTARDDGVGLTIKEGAETQGFGLEMVGILTDQLGGKLTLEGEGGFRAVFDIPVK